jgi:hypothetical protein
MGIVIADVLIPSLEDGLVGKGAIAASVAPGNPGVVQRHLDCSAFGLQ